MALATPVDGGAAYSAASGTSVAPSYPAGITAGDCLVLIVGQKPSTANGGTVTTPTGWTLQGSLTAAGGYGTALAADTGNTNLRIYTKDTVTGSETGTLSVTIGTNNVSWAVIVNVPTDGGTLSFASATGQQSTTPTASLSVALSSASIAAQTGDMFVTAMCIPTDVTTPGQFTNAGVAITGLTETDGELEEPDSGTGNDIGGFVGYSSVTSGTATGTATFTATLAGTLTNVRGPVVTLRIRETLAERTGTFSATETGADAFSSSGDVLVQGSLSASETGDDTFSASGTVIDATVTGSLSVSEVGDDTFSASGNVLVQGALSASETGDDTFSASGTIFIQGTLSASETGDDTFSASGVVTSNTVTGALSATETGDDSFASSGTVLVSGSFVASESGDDTFSATGSLVSTGSLSATESPDYIGSYTIPGYVVGGYTLDGWEGKVLVQGSTSLSEQGSDGFSASGTVFTQGTFAASETGDDTFSASGVLRSTMDGSASLGASGSLTATSSLRRLASASLSSTSSHDAVPTFALGARANLLAQSTSTTNGVFVKVGQVSAYGSGTLTANARRVLTTSVDVSGIGSLVSSGRIVKDISTTLVGTSSYDFIGRKVGEYPVRITEDGKRRFSEDSAFRIIEQGFFKPKLTLAGELITSSTGSTIPFSGNIFAKRTNWGQVGPEVYYSGQWRIPKVYVKNNGIWKRVK